MFGLKLNKMRNFHRLEVVGCETKTQFQAVGTLIR